MNMLRKHKLLLLIPAVFLLGILIGMIPLNMAHRLAGDCPFVHGKQAGWTSPCPFRSLASNGEPLAAIPNSPPFDQALQLSQALPIPFFGPFFCNIAFNSIPLRC
jgi:hypothetical protein